MVSGQAELFAGERVLWSGGPARIPTFTKADAVFLPFGVVWILFVTVWLTAALGFGAPPFFLVFGGVFLCVGLYLVFGRLVVRRAWLRGTSYTVTNRRVIVTATAFGRRREHRAYLNALPPPVMTGSSGTVGTIRFGSGAGLGVELGGHVGRYGNRSDPFPVLTEIDHCRQVRDIIAAAQVGGQG